ncbi:MAG TPA: PIN domain-containing protein [Sphingomonas sp.]|nr:PIN domain-containing protein [Sphingomonas sp.]
MPFDTAAAQRFPAARKARGKFDRLIAAHALALGAALVTHNVRDFRDVPGLRIEDWTI